MIDMIGKLKAKHLVGIVGGSDHVKILEQMQPMPIETEFDFVFSENGLTAFAEGKQLESASIRKHYGDEKLKTLINFALRYIADLDIPVKRGTFVEFRNGMINLSPIGRNCSQEVRDWMCMYLSTHVCSMLMYTCN